MATTNDKGAVLVVEIKIPTPHPKEFGITGTTFIASRLIMEDLEIV